MKTPKWVNVYAYCLSLFCASGLIAVTIFYINKVFDPFEHDYAEGIILYQVLHIFNLSFAYRTIADYPHIVFHYTPLYHMIANLLSRTGLDAMVAARLISLAATLGMGAICAALVLILVPRRAGKPVRYAAALSAGAFALFANSTASCGAAVRSDMLGLALAMLGLWTFVRFADGSPMKWLAFVLFTAAIYCKQTIISAPAACLVTALLMSRRLFLQGLGVLLVLGGGVLAILTYLTAGRFLLHIFVYNVNPFSLAQAFDRIAGHIDGSWPVFASGLAMICFTASRLYPRRARIGAVLRRSVRSRALLCVALFTLFGMTCSLSTGKWGAADNYFLEWDAGIAVLGGCFIAAILAPRRVFSFGPAEWVSLLLPVIWVLGAAPMAYRSIVPSDFMRAKNQRVRSAYSRIIPLIRSEPGPVLSENMTVLVKAGKQIPMEPAIYRVLAQKGVVNQEPFLARVRRQEFSAIILVHPPIAVFSPQIAHAIEERYRVTEQIGDFLIYRPISGP